MKILRIRRGFTTNSSAYTEWLPPQTQGGAGAQNASTPAAPASNTGQQTAAPPAAAGAAGQNATVVTPAQPTVAAPTTSHMAGNIQTVGGVVAALVGIFVIERLFRRLRRKDDKVVDTDE